MSVEVECDDVGASASAEPTKAAHNSAGSPRFARIAPVYTNCAGETGLAFSGADPEMVRGALAVGSMLAGHICRGLAGPIGIRGTGRSRTIFVAPPPRPIRTGTTRGGLDNVPPHRSKGLSQTGFQLATMVRIGRAAALRSAGSLSWQNGVFVRAAFCMAALRAIDMSSNLHRAEMPQPRENLRVVGGLADDAALQDNGSADAAIAPASTGNAKAAPSAAELPTDAPAVNGPAAAAPPPGEAAAAPGPRAEVPVGIEIELKLLVQADQLAHFNEAPIIAANARNNGTRKHLKSVYYDTPERALWEHGLTLRVRQSGMRFSQTVKAEAGDDPLRRGEWEASVPSMAPDLALAMPFIPEKLRDIQSRPLEAVFVSDIHRHQRLVDLPSGVVEVAFDHGVLRAGDRTMPVAEIELELKAGSAAALYEIALRLAEHGAVRPSIHSKSARGFDLAADAAPAARKPRRLQLELATSLDDVLATILRECLRHLLQSLPAAEHGGDPEGVHQLRVALRRLRSAFNLLQSAGVSSRLDGLNAEARWLAQSVSSARELDIFQGATLPTIAEACAAIAGFDDLAEVAERRRIDAYARVRDVLSSRRCTDLVIGLGAFIEARGWRSDVAPEALGQLAEPAVNFARRILAIQYAKVLKRGRHLKSLGAEQRHRLRLAVKKLRYVADFLLPLCGQGKCAKRFAHRLAGLQEELGAYNDMATTASVLAMLGAETRGGGTAAAAITGWQAHAMAAAEPRLREAWKTFVEAKAPWLLEAEA